LSGPFRFPETPFIIAEMSGNHNGSLDRALKIVQAAAEAGADAIKLQTYTADTITLDLDTPQFRVSDDHPLWGGRKLYDLYTEAHTPWEWHEEIFNRAKKLGMVAFSTPFDETSVDFLEALGAPIYKIASMEIVDIPLIQKVASTKKPLIISTGTASLGEIEEAVYAAREQGCTDLTLLVCSSSYPSSPTDTHLARLQELQKLFRVRVGFSDHTIGSAVSIAAVALGAMVIEKHLTLDRSEDGVDSAFSADPSDMLAITSGAKQAVQAIGRPDVWLTEAESESLRLRPSLFISTSVAAGEAVTFSNVRSVRPSGGLPPKEFFRVLGKRFREDLPAGTPLAWAHLRN
jgi:pseudaminic acid synthase